MKLNEQFGDQKSLQIVISDSSVIIDLAKASLIEAAFALPFDFRIPDVMFEDELLDLGAYDPGDLLNAGLAKNSLDGDGVGLAMQYGETYLSLSTNDQFALALAKIESAILLTGDRRLSNAAKDQEVETFGLLWLIDELIAQDALGRRVLRNALQIFDDDPRVGLPSSELQRRIQGLT
ncbi:hypothetical protein [Elongatibacter sediminis]|uniref:PIN domain-containing protein n=1 Tax=Elongatibacter sediminis TaxID=3119006 RepID=A0AAW9RF48_9GAMM